MKGEVVWKNSELKDGVNDGQFFRCNNRLICAVRTGPDEVWWVEFPTGNRWFERSFKTATEAYLFVKGNYDFETFSPVTINFVEV